MQCILRKAGQKSSYHVYLSNPGLKVLNIKAEQESYRLVFYPLTAFI